MKRHTIREFIEGMTHITKNLPKEGVEVTRYGKTSFFVYKTPKKDSVLGKIVEVDVDGTKRDIVEARVSTGESPKRYAACELGDHMAYVTRRIVVINGIKRQLDVCDDCFKRQEKTEKDRGKAPGATMHLHAR